jgi:hypothetical protein
MTTRWLVMTASLFVAAACSGPNAQRSSTPTAPASPMAEPSPTPASSTDPGVTSIDGRVIGGGDYPGYTVKAPGTWSAPDEGHFVVKDTAPGVTGISVWDVGTVPRDPCHWRGQLYDPGPTVDDLAEALAAQPLRNASTPTDVTLGGYRGRYLEWSVPADMVMTGDEDFKGCDVEPSSGHRDFVSWFGNGEGERYQQVPGQVDRLWILDIDGQRLLVDASHSPETAGADRQEQGQIVESIRFGDPAA